MEEVAILVDSSTGLTESEAKKKGFFLIPLLIVENATTTYKDGIDIDNEEIYKKLSNKVKITTSQPILGDVINKVEALLKTYKKVVAVPISSALSGTYASWKSLEQVIGEDKFHVVDGKQISSNNVDLAQKIHKMAIAGANFKKLDEFAETYNKISYGMLSCVDFAQLISGGRISPLKGKIAKLLKLHVLIEFKGGKLNYFDKFTNDTKLISAMKETMFKELKLSNLKDLSHITYMHTFSKDQADLNENTFKIVQEVFGKEVTFQKSQFPAVVAAHIGKMGFAILASKKID